MNANVHSLCSIRAQYFEFPLRKSAVLPERVIAAIFGNIRQIVSINQELMARLADPQEIGQAFLLMGPFLKLYSMYANNHERALATMMVSGGHNRA